MPLQPPEDNTVLAPKTKQNKNNPNILSTPGRVNCDCDAESLDAPPHTHKRTKICTIGPRVTWNVGSQDCCYLFAKKKLEGNLMFSMTTSSN